MSDLYEDQNPEQVQPENSAVPEAAEETVQSEAVNAETVNTAAEEPAKTAEQKRQTESSGPVTYSWVSPKLQGSEESETNQEQNVRNPWRDSNSNVWRAEPSGQSTSSTGTSSTGTSSAGTSSAGTSSTGTSSGTYRYSSTPEEPGKKRRKRSSSGKKSSGTGKKWAATISMAVVFGLVAGLVFTGVTAAGSKLTKDETAEVRVETASPVPSTADSADSSTDTETTVTTTSSGGTVADVAAQCMPSLVTISTISVAEMQSFFGQTQRYEVEGAGTGVIVGQNDTELLIATNHHVVSGAESLSVGFIDETAIAGAVKGYDSDTDLAVVAVNLSDIPEDTMNQIRICEMGDSDDLVLGEQVVAIGNALGYGQSVTSGYISAFNRELSLSDGSTSYTSSGLIQTDASINSGNSGGALLNMKGQLIGINEAKSSGSSSSASVDNIGFAIPINKAEPILENLMTLTTRTKVAEDQASYIGITCADVSEETAAMYNMPTGVCLTGIMENSPAEAAGLKKGDVLTGFDGREVSTYTELTSILQYYSAGETVEIVVQRSDEGEYTERTVSLTLGSASDMPGSYQSGSGENQQGSQGRGQTQP